MRDLVVCTSAAEACVQETPFGAGKPCIDLHSFAVAVRSPPKSKCSVRGATHFVGRRSALHDTKQCADVQGGNRFHQSLSLGGTYRYCGNEQSADPYCLGIR